MNSLFPFLSCPAALKSLWCWAVAVFVLSPSMASQAQVRTSDLVPAKPKDAIRVVTFNVALNRSEAGQLEKELQAGSTQAKSLAAVIRLLRPDVLLLNEVDYDRKAGNAALFARKYLADSASDGLGNGPWNMAEIFDAPVNTGVPSGMDLNNNGRSEDAEDAWGYGRFPGQYGMAVLSRFPIDRKSIRTLQNFRWSQMPGALNPQAADQPAYYDAETWQRLRLSSKSFWDVPIKTPLGIIHLLASHPTPPAFDGAEDRNGCRNHDEIRLIREYIEGAKFLRDDNDRPCGLTPADRFVIAGDLNSDPHDGGSRPAAVQSLLDHELVAEFEAPESDGAVLAAKTQAQANLQHQGQPRYDTGDFNDRSVGNLRVDYVLPSVHLRVLQSGVFWPDASSLPETLQSKVQACLEASDHHAVWVDLR